MGKLLLALLLGLALPCQAEVDLKSLREGGYVLYLRHASTDFSQNDAAMKSYDDCASQRNLTDKGRGEARLIGEQVKRLGIPIGNVLASPFCRTMETARLAFGKAQAMNEVRGGPVRTEDPKRYESLRKLMATKPASGTNTVISSHANPFYALVGPPYLAEGEMAVVRPGDDSFAVVGRIRVEDWQALQ